MAQLECEHVTENLELFALDALDVDETHEIEKHLSSCPDCLSKLHEIHQVISALPLALQVLDPLQAPENLRDTIFEEIDDQPQKSKESGNPVGFWQRLIKPRWAPAFALANVLFIAVIGWLFLENNQQMDSMNQLMDELKGKKEESQAVLDMLNWSATTLDKMRPMASDMPGAEVLIITHQGHDMTALVFHRIPQKTSDHMYQVWIEMNGAIQSGGIVEPDQDGFDVLQYEKISSYSRIAITRETEEKESPSGPTIFERVVNVASSAVR
jgi:hypothetical protein